MKIRTFLLLMLLSVFTLVSFVAAIVGYRDGMRSADHIFDENLRTVAYTLAAVPESSSDVVPSKKESLAIQIWRGEELLLRSQNAPESPISKKNGGFDNNNFLGQRWRSYVWEDQEHQRRVIVSQSFARRVQLSEQMAQSALTPLIVITPILALLIGITITRGLSPLKALSGKLLRRNINDFRPVTLDNPPAELQPVVDTINTLFRKVAVAFEREKRFSSDAAHELRTPLSVLQVSIHNLSEQHPEMRGELQSLHSGVKRMSYVVEQILLLNRTHPDHYKETFQSLALTGVCQKVISDLYMTITNRDQTIELEADDICILGDNFCLDTMLQNLIGNASKYTPEGGSIRVSLGRDNGNATIMVEDSGPGIEAEYRDAVLNRFYRVGGDKSSSGVIGCGLGLAIVKQVLDIHMGTVQLSESKELGGLKVAISLPINGDPVTS